MESTTTPRQSTTTATDWNRPDNPWRKHNVTVTVYNHANRSRDVTPLVNRTLQYWNQHASQYGDYNVTFKLTPGNRSADIVVDYVHHIPTCGPEDDNTTVGCAPLLETGTVADDQEHVEIVAGYANNSTVQILKHEFGHVLGIEHGEEPMPTMQALRHFEYLSRPDAVNRSLPWENQTVSVYVSVENRTYKQSVREQVQHALNYYARGAEGNVPENVSFVVIENESRADVTVRFPTAVTCGEGRDSDASCGWRWGRSTDTDEQLEYYTRLEIRIGHQVDYQQVGWHVGYWLAFGFGLQNDELPPPWTKPYPDPEDEWWTS